jgi:hypothetical protein
MNTQVYKTHTHSSRMKSFEASQEKLLDAQAVQKIASEAACNKWISQNPK